VITDVAPTPVSSIAVPVLGSVENFRLAQGNKAEKNLVNAEAKLAAHEGTTTSSLNSGAGGATSASWELVKRGVENGSVWKTPFDYFKLFLAIIAHFFTTNIYAFYSLVLLVIFLIVRTTLRFFF
jgi:hypothetical protein